MSPQLPSRVCVQAAWHNPPQRLVKRWGSVCACTPAIPLRTWHDGHDPGLVKRLVHRFFVPPSGLC